MTDYPGPAWLARYRERVNNDRELGVIGDWFTTSFALTFGERRYAVKVEKGRIVDIVASPKFDVRTLFGFRAPVAVWRKFLSPDPPPLFHDFFAMLMRVPEFVLEGDGLVAMQNARALHRMMNLMRETGAPAAIFPSTLPGPSTASSSRKRATACRCCVCTPPVPTAGSIAMCSTTRR
jgi:hypothetical protein